MCFAFYHQQRYVQVLTQSYMDAKLWQRSLRLISKICEDCSIIPASYIRQLELIRARTFFCRSGFADVEKGENLELPVAIKSPVRSKTFEVFFMDLVFCRYSLQPGIVSRDHLLETFKPPEYLTFVRSYCI